STRKCCFGPWVKMMLDLTILVLATASAGLWNLPKIHSSSLIVSCVEWFGELGMFCGRMFRAALVPPYEIRELIRQLDTVGAKSLPLVALAGAATGVVLSLETRDSLTRFGAKSFLPAVI